MPAQLSPAHAARADQALIHLVDVYLELNAIRNAQPDGPPQIRSACAAVAQALHELDGLLSQVEIVTPPGTGGWNTPFIWKGKAVIPLPLTPEEVERIQQEAVEAGKTWPPEV